MSSTRNSNESQLYWKKHFLKDALDFRIVADFDADNEVGISSIGN